MSSKATDDERFFPVPEMDLRDAGAAAVLEPARRQVQDIRRMAVRRLMFLVYCVATGIAAVVLARALWPISWLLAITASVGYSVVSGLHWRTTTRRSGKVSS
jgi:hypothetical protein